jgi:aspartate-semialdehyde dehydrogenase
MVGSVLLERMRAERDFDHVEPVFFSTSPRGPTSAAARRRSPTPTTSRPSPASTP